MKPWQIALLRAGGGGVVLGAGGFFAIWAQTSDVQLLITSFMVPFLGTIATRGAVEGWWDSPKK